MIHRSLATAVGPLRRQLGTQVRSGPRVRSVHTESDSGSLRARGESISVNTLIASFATLLVGMAGGGVGAAVWVDSKVGTLNARLHQSIAERDREVAALKIDLAALNARVDMLIIGVLGRGREDEPSWRRDV